LLCKALQGLAAKYLKLAGWAIFSNHNHWVGLSPRDPTTLRTFISELHTETSTALNEADRTSGRQVWFQYWEAHLSYQRSCFARLSYVHCNAVHHRLVREPSLYPWCSTGWFERRANASFYKTIMGFQIERVKVPDEFELVWLTEGG
jgi:putative transposase